MSPAAESRKHTYKVRIYNQTYSIASSASEAEFQQIADYVDHLMHTIASRSGSADSTRAAVMAAMHLADKLRQAEQKIQSLQAEQHQTLAHVEEHTSYLERLLRETLEMEEIPAAAPVPLSGDPDPPAVELETEPRAELPAGLPDALPAPLRIAAARRRGETEAPAGESPALQRPRVRREPDASRPTLFPMGEPEE